MTDFVERRQGIGEWAIRTARLLNIGFTIGGCVGFGFVVAAAIWRACQ